MSCEPGGLPQPSTGFFHEKLEDARQRYERDRNPETRTEYLKVLKQFADWALGHNQYRR
jgi:hypothetical protein